MQNVLGEIENGKPNAATVRQEIEAALRIVKLGTSMMAQDGEFAELRVRIIEPYVRLADEVLRTLGR